MAKTPDTTKGGQRGLTTQVRKVAGRSTGSVITEAGIPVHILPKLASG